MASNVGRLGAKLRNFEAYKKEGFSDSDIIDDLVESGELPKRNLDAYRRADWPDEAILHYLVTGDELDFSQGGLTAVNRGTAVGISEVFGAPSDAIEDLGGIRNKVVQNLPQGSPFFDQNPDPVNVPGGADFFKGQFNRLGGEGFAYDSLADIPLRDRPLAAAGEALGGNVAVAAPIFGAAKLGGLGKFGRQIMKAPKQAAAIETGSALGSAQGAYLGEAIDPGGYGRLAGEVVGGFANPLGTIFKMAGGTSRAVMNYATSLRKEGRLDKLSTIILGALEEAGEDPGKLAQILRKEGLLTGLTAGQHSGSKTLQLMEGTLARQSGKFRGQLAAQAQKALDDSQALIHALSQSTEPGALQLAAKLRIDRIDAVIQGRFDMVKAKLTEARGKFPEERGLVGAGASSDAQKELLAALEDARKVEKVEYWDKVDKNVVAQDTAAIKAKFKDLSDRRLKIPDDKLPPLVSQQLTRIKKLLQEVKPESSGDVAIRSLLKKGARPEPEQLLSGELIIFRSRLLQEGRTASAQQDWTTANIFNEMAEAVLEDLSKIDAPGYEDARDFSRRLNEAFSKTFAGDALSVGRQGAERIDPELMLSRAFAGGKGQADLRFRELQSATEFSNRSMMQQQDDFLRAAATASRKDGVFNPTALTTFLENNGEMLKRFPDLRADLSDVKRAEKVLAGMEKGIKTSFRMRQRASFEQLLPTSNESPADVIGKVLRGNTPQKSYAELSQMAKNSGTGAVGGLKATTLDWAYTTALRPDGSINWAKYRANLIEPLTERGPSAMKIMEQQGVMSKGVGVRVQKILAEVGRVENSIMNGVFEDLDGLSDPIFDLAVRIFGVHAAKASPFAVGGAGQLVIAGAASKFSRNLFEKVPLTKMRDLAIEAAEDPKMMAMLLERKMTPKRKAEVAKRIRVWLINSGLTADSKLDSGIKEVNPVDREDKSSLINEINQLVMP